LLQLDDPHETAVHSHNANPAAVEAAKASARMRDAVRSAPGARPTWCQSYCPPQLLHELRWERRRQCDVVCDVRSAAFSLQNHQRLRISTFQMSSWWPESRRQSRFWSTTVIGLQELIRMLVFSSKEQLRHLAGTAWSV